MVRQLISFARLVAGSLRDLAPIVLVIAFFQLVVLRQPLPDPGGLLGGLVMVMLGLTLFVRGLEMGLFPLGQSMATDFARKGSLAWLLLFAFCLGFGTTAAEPALTAVAAKAAEAVAEAGVIADEEGQRAAYALGLRMTVAVAVGVALVIGVFRIVLGWPLPYIVIGGYALVMALTFVAPAEIVGIAFDSGGVTTSTITVPLVAALGIGLASAIKGRSPLVDGFGLIALASLMPMIFVIGFGVLWHALG